MRLRHKPWAHDKLMAHPDLVVIDPTTHKGKWQQRFKNDQPIHIEVGSGKGGFIYQMAQAHPEINYIAIELQSSVAVSILDLQLEESLTNLQLIPGHGGDLTDFFADGEIDRVYLNFSDPWPKSRHAKRRLTSPRFLGLYRQVLNPTGEIHFKTDNQGLFEYSLASMSQFGYHLKQVWLDLHKSDFVGNIETEYEHKFSSMGKPIYRLEAYYPQNNNEQPPSI